MMRPRTSLLIVLLLLASALPITATGGSAEDRAAGDWVQASTGLPTSGTYFGVSFGDVNNDGKLDIVAASDGGGLRVLLGDGTGQWSAVANPPATSGGYGDVALGDYDADGNADIFAGSPGNGDGNPRGLHVWRGDGKGGFIETTSASGLPTTGYWRGVAVGDVNKDGNLDLAATNGYGTSEGIHVYAGDGKGVFTDKSTGLPTSEDRDSNVALADFDNDGDLDLAAGGGAGVDVYLATIGAQGNLAWTQSSVGLPNDRFSGVSAADWNKDGLPDLVLSAYNAGGGVGVRAYKNTGAGTSWTSSSTGLPTDGDYIENDLGDLDGDGNLDIATAGSYGGEYGIHVYYGNGKGSWGESSPGFPDNVQYVGVELGDYDVDGTLDLVVGKLTRGGGIEVWQNPSSQAPPPQPEVEITFPAGGESLTGGAVHEVSWSVFSGTPPYDLVLKYSTDGGATYTQTVSGPVTQAQAGDGASTWDVPVLDSDRVRVVAELTDGAGQTVTRSGRDFSVDSTAPVVTGTFPRDGASGVSTSSVVVVTFDEGMAASSSDAVSIEGPGSPGLSSPSWSGTQLSLGTTGLQASSSYTVTVSTTATDDSEPGNAMASARSFTFTTGSGETPEPPVVQYTTPPHDASGVAIGASVVVGFSKPMDTAATRAAIKSSPAFGWSAAWGDGNTVLTLVPDSVLAANTRYSLTVSTSALASDGTSLDPTYTFAFTTGDPPDLVRPSVASSYPPDRQLEVSPYIPEVTVTFSEPMDTASVEAALAVSPGQVTGLTWRLDDTVLVIGLAMTDGQRYTVTVGTGATDASGNALSEEFSFQFVTRQFEEPEEDGLLGSTMAPMLLVAFAVAVLLAVRRRGG